MNYDEVDEMIATVKKLRAQRKVLKDEKREMLKRYHATTSRNEMLLIYVEVDDLNNTINNLNSEIMTLTDELAEMKEQFIKERDRL